MGCGGGEGGEGRNGENGRWDVNEDLWGGGVVTECGGRGYVCILHVHRIC